MELVVVLIPFTVNRDVIVKYQFKIIQYDGSILSKEIEGKRERNHRPQIKCDQTAKGDTFRPEFPFLVLWKRH